MRQDDRRRFKRRLHKRPHNLGNLTAPALGAEQCVHFKHHAERIARDEDTASVLAFEAKRAGLVKQQ
jgi:hypothetical protein